MSNVILYQPKKLQLKLFCGRRHFVKEMAINDLKKSGTIMIQILILQCIIMLSQKIVKGSELEFILYTILCLGGLIANFFIFSIYDTYHAL